MEVQVFSISVVMPLYNEATELERTLNQMVLLLRPQDELILVDGESTDSTCEVVQRFLAAQPEAIQARFRLLEARKGRANQMNTGARAATGDLLVFVHADTYLTEKAWAELLVCQEQAKPGGRFWGRFDVSIQGQSRWLPIVGWFVNWRSRLTHIATGDQCLFLSRALFNRIGGFFDQPLMEDIELCKTLKTQPDVLFLPLDGPVYTSGRRWDQNGAWATIVLMWRFRYLYWRGANAYDLARKYRDARKEIAHQQQSASQLAGLTTRPEPASASSAQSAPESAAQSAHKKTSGDS